MPRTSQARRPRLLLAAYACDPGRGSEAGGGWNRAVQAARFCDTSVICEETEFAAAVRRRLEQSGAVAGLRFYFVPQRRWESLLWRVPGLGYLAYNLWQRRVVPLARRLHRENPFDLVHQVNFGTFREPGYLWKLGVPLVWGPLGGTQNYPWRYLGAAGVGGACVEALRSACNYLQLRLMGRVRGAARRAAALLAANSTAQRDFGRVLGVVSQLFPDTGLAAVLPAPRGPRAPGPLRVLWAGHLIPRKALGLLIEALARLPGDVPCEVRVVGDGPEKLRWQRLARRRGVEHAVTWLGWLPHAAMQEQYRWADVFAFTSLRDNLGTVVLEALGAGLPVVCLDHQGVHDVVSEACGIKIPVTRPRDTAARLADALRTLAADAALRQRLGAAAVERARQYTWSRQGGSMADVYRQVLQRRAGIAAGNGRAECGLCEGDSPIFARPSFAGCPKLGQSPGFRGTQLRRRLGLGAAVTLRAVLPSRAEQKFGILLYHRIATPLRGAALPGFTVSRSRFREQMQGLLARGYTPWPLREAIACHAAGRPIPRKRFVVTFDDGCECLYHEAWPVLREFGIPATVALVTAYLDSDAPLPFAEADRSLSTAQCAEMLAGGLVDFATHTHTHADFRADPGALAAELRASLAVLRERFALADAALAFPFGYTTPALRAVAAECGVLCALDTHGGLVGAKTSRLAWGRLAVETFDTAATLAARLDGWYGFVEETWRRWRPASKEGAAACR
jgi:glycosyltransferase involved in cell wall biosynthesis/peptidoglycan/xylan/chitin deacetylase (PgdA/CDA1 family)